MAQALTRRARAGRRLALDSKSVELVFADLVIAFAGQTVRGDITVGGGSVASTALFDPDTTHLGAVSVDANGVATVPGLVASLDRRSAYLLDKTLTTTAFRSGLTIATMTIRASGS